MSSLLEILILKIDTKLRRDSNQNSKLSWICPDLKARREALVVEPLLELALRQLPDERHAHRHPDQLQQTETQAETPG